MVELLMVVAIIGVLAAIAIPMSGNSIRYLKINGDAHDLSNATAVAKMRAAAKFTRSRLFVDASDRTFYIQTLQGAAWQTETGSISHLSSTVSFSYGPVASAPPNALLAQAPACLDASSHPIANTHCIVFNSRGLPIDPTTGGPDSGAIYIADGTAVYGVTVSATGFLTVWRTPYQTTPSWSQQ